MRCRGCLSAIAVLLSLLLCCGPGVADFILPTLPARTGSVVDAADVMRPAQEQSLTARASALQANAGIELVVVTLPSLQGYLIGDWGRALGHSWRIGGIAARGVLLIVAPNDREVRIEVGDGLSSMLSNSAAASIIDDLIIPQFRRGEMSGGIVAGADAIIDEIVQPTAHSTASYWRWFQNIDWQSVGIWSMVIAFIVFAAYRIALDEIRTQFGSPPGGQWPSSDDDRFGRRQYAWLSSSSSSSGTSWSAGSHSSGGFSGHGASGRW